MRQWIIISLGQKKLDFFRVLFSICFLGTLTLVFYYSLQPAPESLEKSQAVTEMMNEVSFLSFSENVVRKIAHFYEFMMVGFWLVLLLNMYLNYISQCISWSLLAGLMISLIDETIQLFVPGRTALISDIWLDFSGVICGIIIGYIIMYIFIAIIKKCSCGKQFGINQQI